LLNPPSISLIQRCYLIVHFSIFPNLVNSLSVRFILNMELKDPVKNRKINSIPLPYQRSLSS